MGGRGDLYLGSKDMAERGCSVWAGK